MKRLSLFLTAALALSLSAFAVAQDDKKPESPQQPQKFNVYVMDFTSIDVEGQKRFLDMRNRPIVIPDQCTLVDKDRVSVNTVMQGVVRTVDATDHTRTNQANRDAQISDNLVNKAKAIDLYNTVVKGPTRPLVLGAQYLTALLGEHPDVFQASSNSVPVTTAMTKIAAQPDFPKDSMLRLAQATGLTHLISGTVSDIRTMEKNFQGYNISVKNYVYEMDVIITMVDLVAQRGVYSKVCTGRYAEAVSPSGNTINHNIYESLMTAAMRQAATDFYEACKPGPNNKVQVTPIPAFVPPEPAPPPAKPAEQPVEKPENLPRPAPETAGPAIVGRPVIVAPAAVPVAPPAVQPVVVVPETNPK